MKTLGEVELYLYSFFNLSVRWGWVGNATTRSLCPRERSATHCIGGWVGPRGRSGPVRKIVPHMEFDPSTLRPVISLYSGP